MSLVVQWLRICLAMQGAQFQSLVRELGSCKLHSEAKNFFKKTKLRTSLMIQWLRLHACNARGAGLIPGWGTRDAWRHGQTKSYVHIQEPQFILSSC